MIQIGFVGARLYLTRAFPDAAERATAEAALQHCIGEELKSLMALAGPQRFLCGVAQVAVGADTFFARACQELRIPERIFLPQHREDYLAAVGSNGRPDFDDAARVIARELLSHPLVIEERVVSDAADRATRFETTNHEILRASDVMIVVLAADAKLAPGGAAQLLEQAKQLEKPAIELRLMRDGTQLHVTKTWHNRDQLNMPTLPNALLELDGGGVEGIDGYSDRLKLFASRQANWLRKLFRVFAFAIVGTHVLATVMATLALVNHSEGARVSPLVTALLLIELVFLVTGLSMHRYLHNSNAVREWALSRLLAELSRSMRSISALNFYPEFLFALQIPEHLRPILRTLCVLHLKAARDRAPEAWQAARDRYLAQRLLAPGTGQIAYYAGAHRRAERWHKWVPRLFLASSLLAIAATFTKLIIVMDPQLSGRFPSIGLLGTLAIVMPVIAVGFLSIAASQDIEARAHIYGEMLTFLKRQAKQIEKAVSARDFHELMIETEGRLLGETTSWLMRRSFMGVS